MHWLTDSNADNTSLFWADALSDSKLILMLAKYCPKLSRRLRAIPIRLSAKGFVPLGSSDNINGILKEVLCSAKSNLRSKSSAPVII